MGVLDVQHLILKVKRIKTKNVEVLMVARYKVNIQMLQLVYFIMQRIEQTLDLSADFLDLREIVALPERAYPSYI